mmetsp:Transcript_12168/g.27624  ORF Transcript_12168/g.27624 Transcript_12168/m.27624 type:complete len:113 (-) Transcript_12168:19-357(-)
MISMLKAPLPTKWDEMLCLLSVNGKLFLLSLRFGTRGPPLGHSLASKPSRLICTSDRTPSRSSREICGSPSISGVQRPKTTAAKAARQIIIKEHEQQGSERLVVDGTVERLQ